MGRPALFLPLVRNLGAIKGLQRRVLGFQRRDHWSPGSIAPGSGVALGNPKDPQSQLVGTGSLRDIDLRRLRAEKLPVIVALIFFCMV
jgi:hypothetical protein